ncbi:hypothetical protein M9Y10_008154 [Tritrichomonas musculus]|uniref:Uncharacterized protein n=1 Tax=Tritrichomonas musculus TaxID=1915356 RepID=A0ABR2IXQ8_9EUKA
MSSRSPTPSDYSRRSSRSPTPVTKHSSKHPSRRQTPKTQGKTQIHSKFLYELDFVDYILLFFLLLFFFAFFSVDFSKIKPPDELKKYDYKIGVKRFYLILESIFLILLSLKKYFGVKCNLN